jgi:membrane protein DedA with SNARE-associated domain
VLDSLEALSLFQLYALMFGAAFTEGVIPPVPGDVAAAFLAFMSVDLGGLWLTATLAIATGSVLGNVIVWWMGRRYGAEWMTHKLGRLGFVKKELAAERAEHRIEAAYRQYGWGALFLLRFIPGVRAMAPAAAGAMKVPLWQTLLILYTSGLVWYGVIVWIAMRVGSDWESVKAAMTRFAQGAGIGAGALALVVGIVVWIVIRRRRAQKAK